MLIQPDQVKRIRAEVSTLYKDGSSDLPFHGWHHVEFVARKTVLFAEELNANVLLAEAAAYTHDLNYIVDRYRVDAGGGTKLRHSLLAEVGLVPDTIELIESIVLEAETAVRDANISQEAKALSDADTLFKSLPITPVVLAPLYMEETGYSLRELGTKIISEQVPLRDQEIYFYSSSAQERYGKWGDINLQLWENLVASLDDPDVALILAALGREP